MEAQFWHDMWSSGVVGFHQKEMNEFMTEYWGTLNLKGQGKVLVPLCGKSLDMIWLAKQGHEVLGVELNPAALNDFLSENGLKAESVNHTHFVGHRLEGLTLLCGDFFKLTAQDCEAVKAVYDRAAIVALPPEMRQAYVTHLRSILPKGTVYLMVTMTYDQSRMSGPPFSVPEEEVRSLFADFATVERLHQVSFSRKGVPTTEQVFVIKA
ncbi:MAG: thiopurine S-methyltransferase [Gammaproteobacteria bacterium]|nr:thiopurine S-methyltransferase [Gammaproteobacteria bacterium]